MCPIAMAPAAGTGPEAGFRGVIRVSFGTAAVPAAEESAGMAGHDVRFDAADREALASLIAVLEQARVGVRLVLAGPPADVAAAAAAAAACGLLEEEVTLLANESGRRLVFCAHCRTANTTVQGVGSEVDCEGCATTLAFSGHFSRRIGGYLGFAAHAEEAA